MKDPILLFANDKINQNAFLKKREKERAKTPIPAWARKTAAIPARKECM